MSRMPLPASGLLFDPDEVVSDSYSGHLRCPCGCEYFRLRHNGRPAPALLRWWAANPIRPMEGQALVIDACCTRCAKALTLHCSQSDSQGWLLPPSPQMQEFILPSLHDQRVRLYVWYCWDETPEMADGQYLASHSLFSLSAISDEQPKSIHVYEANC